MFVGKVTGLLFPLLIAVGLLTNLHLITTPVRDMVYQLVEEDIPKPLQDASSSFLSKTNLTDRCFYVEDICRTSQRWFYRTDSDKKQPKVTLLMYSKVSGRTSETAYEQFYRFEHGRTNLTEKCAESPITNHLVLFTLFNEMLGEFYDRSVLYLWLLSQKVDWVKNAQLYIHIFHPLKRLLDSHHLFTSPFRTHPLLDFTSLLDETPCTCLPRLIFCGYDIKTSEDFSDSEKNDFHIESDSELVVLDPKSDFLPPYEKLGGWEHRDFRNHLRQTMIKENSHVLTDIELYRKQILETHGVPASQQQEYKLVGLTQRNGRRKWLNLQTVLGQTQEKIQGNKIVLVEVSVDSTNMSPYRQIVVHGALDALVGIHGAQLTEAIWMKPESWVVELLPYIPDEIEYGTWTKSTHTPTALGAIYDNTDLNHMGYPLKRENAPYCWDNDELDCWRDPNTWDDRDFELGSETLEKILNTFLVGSSSDRYCQDYRDRAGDVFVLYNINCAEGANQTVQPHHYYWTKRV